MMDKTSMGNAYVTTGDIEEIARRLVEVAQPEKLILFDSVARGDMEPHSDLDMPIIKSGTDHWASPAGYAGRRRA